MMTCGKPEHTRLVPVYSSGGVGRGRTGMPDTAAEVIDALPPGIVRMIAALSPNEAFDLHRQARIGVGADLKSCVSAARRERAILEAEGMAEGFSVIRRTKEIREARLR